MMLLNKRAVDQECQQMSVKYSDCGAKAGFKSNFEHKIKLLFLSNDCKLNLAI